MEELHDNKTRIEKHDETNVQQEIRYVGKIIDRTKDGLKLWEFNTKTGDLVDIEPEKLIKITEDLTPTKAAKVLKDSDCVYFWALNEKSAARKLFKEKMITSTTPNE